MSNRVKRGAPSQPELPAEIVAYANAYRCPDCIADKALIYDGEFWHLDIRHEDTCPTYRQLRGSSS